MGLSLSACGGGSVGSTPAPTPSPTPTPTPSPPPPSTANADLINLTQSESFTNNGAIGSASYPVSSGNFTAASGEGGVDFVYNATTRTYTMTVSGITQTFAPAEIDPALSNANAAVYKKTSGNTTDTLTLTKPGTSGPLNFKYVGGAFWQRTIQGNTSINGNFVASSYGVETPDGSVPRTGGAGYDVTLLGVVARPDTLYSLAGEGKMTVNFLTGAVNATSFANGVREYNAENGQLFRGGQWKYDGTLSSTINAISGTIALYFDTTAPLTGPGNGRFYGPGADEVGIAYQGSGGDGTHFVGVLLGRKTSTSINGTNPSLTNLQFTQTFENRAWRGIQYRASSSTGAPLDFSSSYGINPYPPTFRYNASTQAWEFDTTDNFGVTTAQSTAGKADASLSDSKFSGFSSSSANDVWQLRIYKPGTGNGEIALTYSSYYNLNRSVFLSGTDWSRTNTWNAFGIYTPNSAMPVSGSASYSGRFNGNATDGTVGSEIATAAGSVDLAFDFGTAKMTGNFHPIITYANGTTYDLGLMALTNGIYDNPGVTSGGVVGPPGGLANFGNSLVYNGVLGGHFFGPRYEEFTGIASANYVPIGSTGISGVLWGAFGTKKGP
ncbi:MAG: hypothetical protein ACKOOL_11680 [Novosphingobium sp.]